MLMGKENTHHHPNQQSKKEEKEMKSCSSVEILMGKPNTYHLKPSVDRGQLRIQSRTIARVPASARETDLRAYEPALVSIGPYHQGIHPALREMDRLKTNYTERFLARNPEVTKDKCIKLLRNLMLQIKRCYSDQEVIKTMVCAKLLDDGCFIIELLLLYSDKNDEYLQDPILSNMLKLTLVRFDMLRAENQLPFFVLERLYNLVIESIPNQNYSGLVQLAINFFDVLLPRHRCNSKLFDTGNIYHLLHLVHSCLCAPVTTIAVNHNSVGQYNTDSCQLHTKLNRSATNLKEAVGLKFKGKNDGSLGNILLHKGTGVLEISTVLLHNSSNTLYRNLIAFEQHFYPKVKTTPVKTYVILMAFLIKSKEDLDLLRKAGVLEYTMNNQKAVKFFEQLFKDTIDDHKNLSLEQLPIKLRNLDDGNNYIVQKRSKSVTSDHQKREFNKMSPYCIQLMLEDLTAPRDRRDTLIRCLHSVSFCFFQLRTMVVLFASTKCFKALLLGLVLFQSFITVLPYEFEILSHFAND